MKCWPIIGIVLRWLNLCHDDQCNTEEILVERGLKYFKNSTMPKLAHKDYKSFSVSSLTLFGYSERALDFQIANAAVCEDIIRCAKPAEADKLLTHYKAPGNVDKKSSELVDIMSDYFSAPDLVTQLYSMGCAESLSGADNLRKSAKIVEAETGNEPFDIDAYFKEFETRFTQEELNDAHEDNKFESDYREQLLREYKTKHVDEWDVLFRFCARATGGALGHEKYAQLLEARKRPYSEFEKLVVKLRNENPKLREVFDISNDCAIMLYFRPVDPK